MNKHQALVVVVVFLVALLGQARCQQPRPEVVGWLSGVIPFHKDAIATSLVWRRESMCPKMLMWMRPSEYRPSDYIAPGMFGEGFPGFNPAFETLVMGGFNLGRLDESGWSPYGPDNLRENTQLVDVCGLQALIDTGRFDDVRDIRLLTDDHMSATDPYFRDAGYSRGLAQNIFCAGNSADANGRIIAVGGHDKGGNNGIRKIIIFDPETEMWLDRPVPCVRAQWEMDPTGTLFPHCSPLVDHNTDPLSSSDLKYQRWYPTSVLLPDGRLLVLSGTDQNTTDPDNASATKVRIATPEVYDPVTDRNVQLESARRLQPMYPRSFVVQTGREWDDWVVCSVAKVIPPLPTPQNISQFDPWRYDGSTACLDVQAALADPDRDSPAEGHHWTEVDRAQSAHDSGAAVFMVDIKCRTEWSQRAFVFGGDTGNGTNSAAAERIDFSQAAPRWERMDDLQVSTTQNNAVVLPDGSILVVGGQESNYIQHYDPDTGRRTTLMSHVAPRYDHSTVLVMPNGGVWIMGGNRVDLLPRPEVNQSVPVLEYYKPAYFFKKGPAPVIAEADDHMRYGESYEIGLATRASHIGSVVLLRTGPITHNWAWDNRYVRLPFDATGRHHLQVMAPPLPGLAPPGDYLLFVVGENGRPGEARRIRLG